MCWVCIWILHVFVKFRISNVNTRIEMYIMLFYRSLIWHKLIYLLWLLRRRWNTVISFDAFHVPFSNGTPTHECTHSVCMYVFATHHIHKYNTKMYLLLSLFYHSVGVCVCVRVLVWIINIFKNYPPTINYII